MKPELENTKLALPGNRGIFIHPNMRPRTVGGSTRNRNSRYIKSNSHTERVSSNKFYESPQDIDTTIAAAAHDYQHNNDDNNDASGEDHHQAQADGTIDGEGSNTEVEKL